MSSSSSPVADPGALLAMLGAAVLYGGGVTRAWDRAGRGRIVAVWQPACFGAALLVTAVALISPLDRAAENSLTAHMVQHVLLISVAAPLFAISAPVRAVSYALDASGSRRRLRRLPHRLGVRRRWAALTAAALVAHTVTVAIWHVPAAYASALGNAGIHGLEHLSFLLTAVLLWWAALGNGRRLRRGTGVLVLFVTTLPMNGIGLLMTLARSPWYPAYVHGSSAHAVEDQQLAGVVMWGFGGVAALIGAFALFVSWLDGLERATPARPPDMRTPRPLGSGAP